MNRRFDTSEESLKQKLDAETYHVAREKGTETPFSGEYWNHHEKGIYRCKVCGNELFSSETKFDSGTGWPSFTDPMNLKHVELKEDVSHGMHRTEVMCKNCGAHLGHVFDDLPAPRPDVFYIYIIECDNGSMYIGQTQDLQKRWDEHRRGVASEYTTRHKPIKIIHYEMYKTREEAVLREHDLKTGFGRKWLQREYKAGRTRQAGGSAEIGKRYCINSVCLDFESNKKKREVT